MTDEQEEPTDRNPTARQLFEEGLKEFRAGRFFEAHDVWEEFWQRLHGHDRRYLQGLIHLAVGAYHFENGNHRGACSQWQKATAKIGEYPAGHWGLDTSTWLQWISQYLDGTQTEPLPSGLPFQSESFPSTLKLAED